MLKPALIQNEIHPYYQEKEVVEYMHNLGIVMQAWYPFGGRGHTSEIFANETIGSIAESHGVSSAQVILHWHLQRGIVAIPGSSNPEHILENISVFDFELTDKEMEDIAVLSLKILKAFQSFHNIRFVLCYTLLWMNYQ
jgi:diketogulonate reductase-like aldo/keto reductase